MTGTGWGAFDSVGTRLERMTDFLRCTSPAAGTTLQALAAWERAHRRLPAGVRFSIVKDGELPNALKRSRLSQD